MKVLENLIDKRAGYSIGDLVKTLFLILYEPLGRPELMRRLGLKEASVKTLLRNLAKNKLIKPTVEGAVLTNKGKKLIGKIIRKIPKLPVEVYTQIYTDYGLYKKLYRSRYDLAILVKMRRIKFVMVLSNMIMP